MKANRNLQIYLPLLVLMLAILACSSSSNEGTKVGEVDASSVPTTVDDVLENDASDTPATNTSPAVPSATPGKSVYTVGDIIAVQDHTIVINSVSYINGVVKINFLIENKGASEITVSSLMSLNAKTTEGVVLEQMYFDCGSSMDGTIISGDRLKGDICWELPQAEQFKVYYESNFLSSGAVVWQFDPNNLPADVVQTPNKSLNIKNLSKVGDVIEANNQLVTLNSVQTTNNRLMANFTIENQGTEDVNVSSLMSFHAKTADGVVLDQDIFDCGTSLDGSILSGDKLRGDICWQTGGISPIYLYYDSDVFSSGTIVWAVE